MWQILLFVGEIYHLQVGYLDADSGCLNSGAGYGWAGMVKSLLDFSLLFHL
ncbi:hypothetical protein ES288_A08G086700v1 [Gossypium darwinii]|uniref:Uncharacterized protein n=2 Tax=Gossypium TaxID=3633 RepID=A0A5D2PDD6_GOSTO|nr:hypothetical protein ES288_A08G086700v1 [Gossypium darwinii]TYI13863.1 hypothetical protein ES332_A08G087500v1 [Gossypium tomentosum]